MTMRKTSVAIDEELLNSVQGVLATKTLRETIEKAFLEVLRAKARRDEILALEAMDGMELTNSEVMAGAWRH